MKYANIKYYDVANGEGVRTSLFVSGCTHHCKNCFNSIAWDFNYGEEFTKEVEEKIIASLEPYYIKGLTLLGGEPMEIGFHYARMIEVLGNIDHDTIEVHLSDPSRPGVFTPLEQKENEDNTIVIMPMIL